jgi:LPS export ABC transporter protein LptC
VLLGACALAGACTEADTPPLIKSGSPADTADQFMRGMSVKLNDAGVQRAEIRADSAYAYNENTLWLMHTVHSQFFTSTGVQEGVLTAKAARFDTKSDLLEATGDVVLVAQDGRRLTTQQLVYDKSKDLIHSDSAFKYTRPDGVLEGVGFDSDPGMSSFKTRGAKGKGSTMTVPKQ